MKRRGYVSIIVVAMLLLSSMAFAGGQQGATTGSGGGAVNPAGTFPIVDEQLSLTFYREGNLTAEDEAAIDDNYALQYIEEKLNVDMNFIHLNAAEGKTKMILSFAAEDYPDATFLSWNTMFSRDDVMQYGVKEKLLLPLNDYIDEYGVELKNIFALRPNHEALLTAPDGNIYGIPRFTECYHCMSYPKMWLNYTWMENLGLDEPTTTDEFYKVLKAFKTQDPNGNGKADEVPLTGNVEWSCALEYWLMNAFIYTDAASTATNPRPFMAWMDNKVTFVANRPEYRDGIEWIKMLYDEGLIDQGNFTQNVAGMQQLIRSEPLAVGGYTVDHVGMGVDFGNKPIADQYNALPPVAGPDGVRFQPLWDVYSQLSGFSFAIFDTNPNPAATYRIADYLIGEEAYYIQGRGMEGHGFEYIAPGQKNLLGGELKIKPILLPPDATEEETDEYNRYRFWFGLSGDIAERRASSLGAPTPESISNDYEVRLAWETQKTAPYWPEVALPRLLFMEKEIGEEFAELKTNIVSHVLKNTSLFITGARDLDEWDAYLKELDRFGVQRYVEIYSEAYETFLSNMK